MIQISTLTDLDPADLERINQGYTSTHKYVVQKVETPAQTTLSLTLTPLPVPYTKRWYSDEAELARYRQVVAAGLSRAAYVDGRMAALAIAEAQHWNRSLWIWEFHVEPAYRGQGVGRQLMEAMAIVAQQAGLRVLVCETQNTNVPAINFYRAVGFELDAVDLSYYTNQDIAAGEVAFFMKRKLNAV
jgi:ribosomal protein S18 acetylase RimI-like enzyme